MFSIQSLNNLFRKFVIKSSYLNICCLRHQSNCRLRKSCNKETSRPGFGKFHHQYLNCRRWNHYYLQTKQQRIRSRTATTVAWSLLTNSRKGLLRSSEDLTSFSNTHRLSSVSNHINMAAQQKQKFDRLPKTVVPFNYRIRLTPNLQDFTFEGQEQIQVHIISAVREIRLHACDIVIHDATFQGQDQPLNATVNYYNDKEEIGFVFASNVEPGTGVLSINFTGQLNDKLKGFYRSKYTVGEEDRYAAVTQFEPTDARRAFPCWDEPAIKATFDVILVVPRNRVALSNMHVLSDTQIDGNLREVTFATTPIMSTYLVAFVVGEYDYIETTDEDGVLIRVYTPLGKALQGRFALDVAAKTLPFYKRYFDIAYPLPKLDLIAIADFSAGAMENWGLITYRETALLVDPDNSSSRARQWVAVVVGHELAHQWFGNLVTMEWWTHLWLNEGFASWIENLCVDHCFPEFDIWTQFVNNKLGQALTLDALNNSHPIEVEVGHPSEVDEIFDIISYSKGSSVIRMLHEYLGERAFREGLQLYLDRHKYSNTFTEDLWQALGEASGQPVARLMSTWTVQMGFPVLKVSQIQDGNNRKVRVTQSKFTADGSHPDAGYQWLVPILYSSSAAPDRHVVLGLLEGETDEYTISHVPAGDWIKLNAGSVGVYRVMYPSEMLDDLVPAITNLSLPPKDRLGLQSDLFALARAGLTPAVDVLKVIQAFKNETDFTVWSNLSTNISSFSTTLQHTDCYADFNRFVQRIFSRIAATVGWDAVPGEDSLVALLREVVLQRMSICGDVACIAEANKRFEAHYSNRSKLPADLRSVVYTTVLRHGDRTRLDQIMELYDRADMQEEKDRLSRAMGAVQDPQLIERVLNFSLTDNVRSQDTVFVIAGTTGTVQGRQLAWTFFKDNFQVFSERYASGFLLPRLVQSTTSNFVTEEQALEVEAFFQENPVPAAERTVRQSVENIRLNVRFLERELESVRMFLASQP